MTIRETIKDNFLIEATNYGEYILIGDHKKANKSHKKLQALYDWAKEQNQADVFSELINETNESVCLWASTFTLKILPIVAQGALEKLAKLPNITGLSAKTTLDLWKEGKLNLL